LRTRLRAWVSGIGALNRDCRRFYKTNRGRRAALLSLYKTNSADLKGVNRVRT
jgi:hypothetical protein